jgi:hypothetical protein
MGARVALPGYASRVFGRSRATVVALGLAMLASSWLILWQGRGTSFGGDDLFYYARLVDRDGVPTPDAFGLDWLLAPHNGHMQLVGKLVYEGLFATVGADYNVFRVVGLAGFLACVLLFFVLARPRVGDAPALLGSVLLLFCGAAWEVMLWPFDLHTTFSLAAGLGALLVLERGGRRADLWCCALLIVSLATIEVGLAFLAGVAVSVLLRDDRWQRIWIVTAPAALYLVWAAWAQGFGQSELELRNLELLATSVSTSLAATVGAFAGQFDHGPGVFAGLVTPTGLAPVLAVAVAVPVIARVGRGRLTPAAWTFLTVLLAYWALITLADRAPDSSRYIFVGAIMLLLVGAELLRGRAWGVWALAGFVVVIAIGLPAGIGKLNDGRRAQLVDATSSRAQYAMFELAGDEGDPDYMANLDGRVKETAPIPNVGIRAGDYLAGAEDHGSIAYPLDELRRQPAIVRAGADAALIGVLRLDIAPATAGIEGGRCETPPVEGATARFELPPGGALVDPVGTEPVDLRLARFDPDAPGIHLDTIQEGDPVVVRIPPDRAPDPWIGYADAAVRVCAIDG